MSVYIDKNNNFIDMYGTKIASKIKNTQDLVPIMTCLEKNKNIKTVKNLHLTVIDVFSQTLASTVGETCPVVEEWYRKNGGYYEPYKLGRYDVILDIHYKAKELLNEYFPKDFCVDTDMKVCIKNNKVLLEFKINQKHRKTYKNILSALNYYYKLRKGITKHIVLGYVISPENNQQIISDYNLKIINTLIPNKIYVHKPDVYHYINVDSLCLYSENMF